jgi:ABC-2 type transport system permease protein
MFALLRGSRRTQSGLLSWSDRISQLKEQNTGLLVLYRKELADHLNSKRFSIIAGLVFLTGLASIYAAAMGIRAAVAQQEADFVFLRLFTSGGNSLPPFVSFVSLLGPLIGLSLGFDAINGERSRRTLSRLLAQPIFRDAVINGKFLAGVTILGIMLLSLAVLVSGLGLVMIGIPPTGEELVRILVFFFLTTVYMALWLALGILFSVLFRQAATSALAGIATWLFFAVFTSLLAGLVANALFPVMDQNDFATALRNQNVELFLSRLSPSVLYNEAMVAILNPNLRALGPVLLGQIQGAIPGPLPLGQSLLLIWPHLTGLVAATLLCFAASYALFMRQEIRAD